MKWKVVFQKSAYKEYQKLPKKIKLKIDESLELLSISPFNEILIFKKIRGAEDLYRIRIGNYRLVYSLQNKKLIVRVIRIGHRKDVYKAF